MEDSNSDEWSSQHFGSLPWGNLEKMRLLLEECVVEGAYSFFTWAFMKEITSEKKKAYPPSPVRFFNRLIQHGCDTDRLNKQELESAITRIFQYRVIEAGIQVDEADADRSSAPGASPPLAPVILPSYASTAALHDLDSSVLMAKRLSDLKSLAQDALDILFSKPTASSAADGTVSESSFGDSALRFSRMCRSLHDSQYHAILSNFETAVFHLGYLLEGHTDFPARKETLQNYLAKQGNTKYPQSLPKLALLRGPLHSALFISPLCLIIPARIDSRSPGRAKCFQAWRAYSAFGAKPTIIACLENAIVKILFSCATSRRSPLQLLEQQLKPILVKATTGEYDDYLSYYSIDRVSQETIENSPLEPSQRAIDQTSAPITIPITPSPTPAPCALETCSGNPAEVQTANDSVRADAVAPIPPIAILESEFNADLYDGSPTPGPTRIVQSPLVEDLQRAEKSGDTTTRADSNQGEDELALTDHGAAPADSGDQGEDELTPANDSAISTDGDQGEDELAQTDHDAAPADSGDQGEDELTSPNNGASPADSGDQAEDELTSPNNGASPADSGDQAEDELSPADSKSHSPLPQRIRSKWTVVTNKSETTLAAEALKKQGRKGSKKSNRNAGAKANTWKPKGKGSKASQSHSAASQEQSALEKIRKAEVSGGLQFRQVIDLTADSDDDNVVLTSLHRDKALEELTLGEGKHDLQLVHPIPGSTETITRSPAFNDSHDLQRILKADALAQGRLKDKSAASRLKSLTKTTYTALSTKAILKELKYSHILVHADAPRLPSQPETGDAPLILKKDLQQLGSLTLPRTALDFSKPEIGSPLSNRQVKVSTSEILRSIISKDGRRYECMDYHSRGDFDLLQPYQSETRIWEQTQKMTIGHQKDQYPTSGIRWAAFTSGATYRLIHASSAGMGIFAVLQKGLEIWYLASPAEGSSLASMQHTTFLDVLEDSGGWIVEAVVMLPDSRIILGPNTLVLAVSLEPSIVLGGYFISTSLLLETGYGILHSFAVGHSKKTYMAHTFMFLSHIVAFFHSHYVLKNKVHDAEADLLDLKTMDGILNVLMLGNLFQLGNVLNDWGYSDSSVEERVRFIRCRQRLTEVIQHITVTYELQENVTDVIDCQQQFFSEWLAHIAAVVRSQRINVEAAGIVLEHSSAEVHQAIERCFRLQPRLHQKYLDKLASDVDITYAWEGEQFTISELNTPNLPPSQKKDSYLGYTYDDVLLGLLPGISKAQDDQAIPALAQSEADPPPLKRKRSPTATSNTPRTKKPRKKHA